MPGTYTVIYAFDTQCDGLCEPMSYLDAWAEKFQLMEEWCMPYNWFKVVRVG